MGGQNNDDFNEFMKHIDEAVRQKSFGRQNQGNLTPAWGGSREQGSVPVPNGFESITNLGPATAVYGAGDTSRFYINVGFLGSLFTKTKALVLYRDGFAYRVGNENIQIWRWDEISMITNNLSHKLRRWIYHSFTLTKKNGESVVLDETIDKVSDLIDPIKKNVFALLLPPLTTAYNSGQPITFGPIAIHRQGGLQMGGKVYQWADIMDVKIEHGYFKITLRDWTQYSEYGSNIPNIELLCKLIGLKFNLANMVPVN